MASPTLDWRSIATAPGKSFLFAHRPSTNTFLVVSRGRASGCLFEIDGERSTLLAAGASQFPINCVPVALYEQAPAVMLLATTPEGGLARFSLSPNSPSAAEKTTFKRLDTWPQFGDFAYVFDSSHDCVWAIGKRHPFPVRKLRREWTDVGTLPLDASIPGCDYLATYEPAEDRIVLVAGRNAGWGSTQMVAFALKDETISPLPAPPLIERLGVASLASHPKTSRALLLNPGTPPLMLEPSGWKPAPLEIPPCFAAASGEGELVLFGAREASTQRRALLGRTSGQQLTMSSQSVLVVTEVIAGPSGACAIGRGKIWDRPARFVYALEEGGWRFLPGLGGLAVATPDDFLFVGPKGSVTSKSNPAQRSAEGKLEIPDDAGAAWDATRNALVVFGGDDTNTTREWDGKAWKELKPKKKPTARNRPLMCHVPELGVVMVGGEGKSKSLPETCVFDGKTWEIFPGLKGIAPDRLVFLGFDTVSQSLLLGEASESNWEDRNPPNLRIHRYLGQGRWSELARVVLQGGSFGFAQASEFGAAFDPVRRELIGAGEIDDDTSRSGIVRTSLAELLDGVAAKPKSKRAEKTLAPAPKTEPIGADAFAMKFERKGSGDYLHGLAPIARWPKCKSHKRTMDCVAVFHADQERLPLEKHVALVLFGCSPGCDAYEAVLVAKKDLVKKPAAPAGHTPEDVRWIRYGAAKFERDPIAEGTEDKRKPGGSKLGGTPTWVQSPEVPSCKKCKKPMRLAAQLDSNDTGMNFGDSGIGYLFVCGSEHAAEFISQSA